MPAEYVPILIITLLATALGVIGVGVGHLLGPAPPQPAQGRAV